MSRRHLIASQGVVPSKYESLSGVIDQSFPEYELPPVAPITLGQKWYKDAKEKLVTEPRSMTLTTGNRAGIMTSRIMASLDFDENGVVFATHSSSRKIRDISESRFACGHFYWREIGRQLSISGCVEELERKRAEIEWSNRPIPLHAMSTASRQSEPMDESQDLLRLAEALQGKGPLPCPDRFRIYILRPQRMEFWSACSNRLHKRLVYEKTSLGWEIMRLQP